MNSNWSKNSPNDRSAPLSWITYGFIGISCVIGGVVAAFHGFGELIAQPEVSFLSKVFLVALVLAVWSALVATFLASSKDKLKLSTVVLAMLSVVLGGISGSIREPDIVAFVAVPIMSIWFGIYSLTRIPISIRQRRIRKLRRSGW